jgi:2-(3-amino-3-carboxypropyl)histidine synthase
MKSKTIQEINQIYNIEIEKIIKTIKKQKAKKTLLQFPEGMKPYAQTISNHLENQTNTQTFIWMNSCFGACDLPTNTEKLGIDLIIQFGHSKWRYKGKKIKEL